MTDRAYKVEVRDTLRRRDSRESSVVVVAPGPLVAARMVLLHGPALGADFQPMVAFAGEPRPTFMQRALRLLSRV